MSLIHVYTRATVLIVVTIMVVSVVIVVVRGIRVGYVILELSVFLSCLY